MKHLIFDTETSGLFDFKQPADAPGQPRVASFAAIKIADDFSVEERVNYYVKPDGWSMPEEASKVHGLTDEFLHANGVPVAEVLDYYSDAILSGRIAVAFNAQFDLKMMRAELRRAGRPDLFEVTRNICVMRPMVNICKLPGRYGFKYPKLIEALREIGVELEGAHQADNDAEGARLVFEWLRVRNLLPEPAVYFAKDKPEATRLPDVETRVVTRTEDPQTWPAQF